MTNSDPAKGSAQDLSLRRQLAAMERQREAHYRELDRQLAAGARKLEASQLAVTVESLQRQTADALAELEDDGPDEPPAQPPLAGERQGGMEQEAAQAAAAIREAPLGSETHMALRRQFGISKPFVL